MNGNHRALLLIVLPSVLPVVLPIDDKSTEDLVPNKNTLAPSAFTKLFLLTTVAACAVSPVLATSADVAGREGVDEATERAESLSLKDRIKRLEDIEAIRALRFTYHRYVNTGRFTDIPDLFTDDARVELDEMFNLVGKDQIQSAYNEMPGEVTFIRQYPHNLVIQVDGDLAQSTSYFEARYVSNGRSLMIAGQFDEEYARMDGRWLIKKAIMKLDFAAPLDVGWAGSQTNYLSPPSKPE